MPPNMYILRVDNSKDVTVACLQLHKNLGAGQRGVVVGGAVSLDHVAARGRKRGDVRDDVNHDRAFRGRAVQGLDVQCAKVDGQADGGVAAHTERVVQDGDAVPLHVHKARAGGHGNVDVTSQLNQIFTGHRNRWIKCDLAIGRGRDGNCAVAPGRRSAAPGLDGGRSDLAFVRVSDVTAPAAAATFVGSPTIGPRKVTKVLTPLVAAVFGTSLVVASIPRDVLADDGIRVRKQAPNAGDTVRNVEARTFIQGAGNNIGVLVFRSAQHLGIGDGHGGKGGGDGLHVVGGGGVGGRGSGREIRAGGRGEGREREKIRLWGQTSWWRPPVGQSHSLHAPHDADGCEEKECTLRLTATCPFLDVKTKQDQ